eukprot:15335779-Ditylum_brightwellii.AAC.1
MSPFTLLLTVGPQRKLLQIKAIFSKLDLSWDTYHVKGHQSGLDLTWEAQLNSQADALATEAFKAMPKNLLSCQH